MSVLQPISYGLVHQIGPGSGARGFGSYKADNTELIRPYQQEASSPIGRGYPMGIVSGAPTVYDPRAGIKEDPVVVLLKKILGMKTVVDKAPDAGFKNNLPFGGGGDYGMGGGGGGNVVVGNTLGQAPAERVYDDSTLVTDSYKTASEGASSIDVNTSIDYSRMGLSEVYEQRWDDWIDVVGDALDEGSFYGLEKSAIVGSERYDPRLEALAQLDDILLELRILDLDSDRGMVRRYRNSDVYYAGLAELTGEISFDDTFAYLVRASDEERIAARKEILDKLKERGIDVLSKSTIEANVLKRTNNQGSMTSSGSSLGDIDMARRSSGSSGVISANTLSHGFYQNPSPRVWSPVNIPARRDSDSSKGSRRSSLLSFEKPYTKPSIANFLARRGTGVDAEENKATRKTPYSGRRPRRTATIPNLPTVFKGDKRKMSSSSSGNSSGVSFDPKKPDTSKAFNRPSKKKKNWTKKK